MNDEVGEITDLATKLLLSRLDQQDKVQDQILHEVKRTNGNVIDLQTRISALEGKNIDGRLVIIERRANDEQAVRNRGAIRAENRRWRLNLWAPIAAVLLSGAFGTAGGFVGHVLGAW